MSAYDYEIDLKPLAHELGGGYVAIVPELAGCISDGATREEALANVIDAIRSWILTAGELGRPVPEPHRLAELKYG